MSTPEDHSPPDEYLEFARAAFEHRQCRSEAEQAAAEAGAASGRQLEVTTAPQPADTIAVRCPHGVRYWLVPTAELRARVENGSTER